MITKASHFSTLDLAAPPLPTLTSRFHAPKASACRAIPSSRSSGPFLVKALEPGAGNLLHHQYRQWIQRRDIRKVNLHFDSITHLPVADHHLQNGFQISGVPRSGFSCRLVLYATRHCLNRVRSCPALYCSTYIGCSLPVCCLCTHGSSWRPSAAFRMNFSQLQADTDMTSLHF